MDKPALIIVCGRPGSGKSTLAHKLANKIRCPLISRDELKEGYINTTKTKHQDMAVEQIKSINSAFFNTLELLLESKITIIAEAAFQHKLWAPQYERLAEKADIIIIQCVINASLANKRYLERKEQDPQREYFHGDNWVMDEKSPFTPPQFLVPLLEVDTTEDYKPGIPEICLFIKKSCFSPY
jgi:predicted kinase